MHRKTFIKVALTRSLVPLLLNWSRHGMDEDPHSDPSDYFLGADQSGDQIVLFRDTPDSKNVLTEEPIWSFKPAYRPTDAKRLDVNSQISVLVASHGAIYKVPFNHTDRIVWAKTHQSCHSIEMLPDGNLISANSNDHCLTIHYYPTPDGLDRIKLTASVDFPFNTAHGVVFDKIRNCIWAIGEVLGKFAYSGGDSPHLKLMETYPLPYGHTDGHDLFPFFNGNLLVTTHQGVLELPMGNFAYPLVKSNEGDVKSAVSKINGDIYITDPTDIPGYETWQTDTIVEITSGLKLRRPGAKFYKVRLWERNEFSY